MGRADTVPVKTALAQRPRMSIPLQAVNAGLIDAAGWVVGLGSLAAVGAWLAYLFR
jgi:hypothetical protein